MFINQVKSTGEEIIAKFVPILTYMYQHSPSTLRNMSADRQAKILECATNMIKCNVSKRREADIVENKLRNNREF